MFQFKSCNAGIRTTKDSREKHQPRHNTSITIQDLTPPLWTLEGVSTGSLLRRTDLLKTLFVCICLCNLCPVSTCGVDPMRYVENFARSKGIESPKHVLNYLRLNTPSDYDRLMSERNEYIACNRMVHTGYFKRSSAPAQQQLLPVPPFLGGNRAFEQQGGNKLSQLLTKRGGFESGAYLQPGMNSAWSDESRPLGQSGPLDSLTLFEEESYPSYLQQLRALGQSASALLPVEDRFEVPGFYKALTKKRR